VRIKGIIISDNNKRYEERFNIVYPLPRVTLRKLVYDIVDIEDNKIICIDEDYENCDINGCDKLIEQIKIYLIDADEYNEINSKLYVYKHNNQIVYIIYKENEYWI
jgi:hypothetical protein